MLTSVNMYVLSIRNLTVALTWAIRRVVLCAFLVSLVMGFESNHLKLMVHLNEYQTDPVNTQHLDGLRVVFQVLMPEDSGSNPQAGSKLNSCIHSC